MPDWLWYAACGAVGFNLGSGLAWWYAIRHYATRDRERSDRWRTREAAHVCA